MKPNRRSHRQKGRALCLAALVVLSAIALSASVAGTAVAIDESASIDRTVTDQTLAPGESTQVTVEVTANGQSNFTIVEQFDPAFESVEIVDADGADFSGVNDANDELFATYGDREHVTLTYEVTVGENPVTLDGFVDSAGTQIDTTGDTAIDVLSEEPTDEAVRTIADSELAPGESTQVTVEVTPSERSDFTIVEQFDPAFESVEIVDDDGADFSGVNDANDELFATYGDREQATLTYEVTLSENATTNHTLDGFVDKAGVQTATTGDTTVEIASLEEQIAALKEEIAALEEQIADLESENAALKDEIADLEEQIADLEAENENLKEENQNLEEENQNLKEENQNLTERINELEGTDDESTDGGDDGIPGFGIAVAVTALIGAALLAARRQT